MRFFSNGILPVAAVAILAAACGDSTPTGSDGVTGTAAKVAAVKAASVQSQTAAAGTATPTAPAVRVTSASGAALSGVAVTFVVTAGGGAVQSASAESGADGVASVGAWTLGTVAGPQALEARVAGQAPVRFSAVAVAGPASRLAVLDGNAQQATIGQAVPRPPTVAVLDAHGNAVAGAAVSFEVVSGGGSVSAAAAQTDASGLASVVWTLGTTTGTNILKATSGDLPPASFTAEATAPAVGSFHITVRYLSSATTAQQQAVTEAVTRWRTVITGDLPDVPMNAAAGACFPNQPAVKETIDDLLLYVDFSDIDGAGKVLGQAGPCFIRNTSGLPVLGFLKLDRADLQLMQDNGSLGDVVLHEIGHVLGIGTLWDHHELMRGSGTDDPFFVGARAIDGYRKAGATSASSVPIENTGGEGTRDGHWRESVFGNELMTGYISSSSNPLSAVTIGSLLDMGYNGTIAAANGYSLGGGSGGLRLGEGERLVRPRYKVDLLGQIRPM